jgi:hypothetical protein
MAHIVGLGAQDGIDSAYVRNGVSGLQLLCPAGMVYLKVAEIFFYHDFESLGNHALSHADGYHTSGQAQGHRQHEGK